MIAHLIFGLLMAHFVGDYMLQSHWMASEKVKHWFPALVHGIVYTLPFVVVLVWAVGVSAALIAPLLIITLTHAVIDRYRLAKHVGWLKNQLGPKHTRPGFKEAMSNGGYNESTPLWLSSFLLFVTDNTMHVLINYSAVFLLLPL